MDSIYRGINNASWVYGDYYKESVSYNDLNTGKRIVRPNSHIITKVENDRNFSYYVTENTVGRCSGLNDVNGKGIFEGDIVKFFEFTGEVVVCCGTFGVVCNFIDFDLLGSNIEEYTGCDNSPAFCRCDNFVSLWELYWNFNEEENCLNCVEIVGNTFDNPNWRKENE